MNCHKSLIISILLLAAGNISAFDIVKNNKAASVIIIPAKANQVVEYAAKELQYHILQSTSAKIPIINENQKSDIKEKIYLGLCKKTVTTQVDF